MTKSIKLLVIFVTFSLITNIVSEAVDTSEYHGSPDLSRRSPESGVDETMQGSNSFESSPDYASDSGNSDTDYDQDLDFQPGGTGDLPQPDRQDGDSGSNSNDEMSKMEEEIEKLSDEMRRLESQVSQNDGSGSSRKVNQLEDELEQVKSELQTIADQIQGKTSELSDAESQLENQLYREMKRIEEELKRIEAMTESNTGRGDKVEETFQTNNDANDYNLDNDFISGQSRVSEENNNDNNNNNNNDNNNDDVNNPETSSYDYVYSADVDFLSNGEDMFTAVEAQQIQFQAKVIGIIFGSVLGIVIVVGLMFGCFINVLLYIKKKQSGSKDESTSLTT